MSKRLGFLNNTSTYFLNAFILVLNYTVVHLWLLLLARNHSESRWDGFCTFSHYKGFHAALQKDVARDRKGEN